MKKLTSILSFLIILAVSGVAWGTDFTVCSSGCSETTVSAVLANNDLSSGDNTITVTENTTENRIYWGAADTGTAGHPNILQGSSEAIKITANADEDSVVDITTTDYITIRNITLEGSDKHTLRIANGKTGHTITNVTVTGGATDGSGDNFYIAGGGTDINVSYLTSTSSGQDDVGIGGVYTTSSFTNFTLTGAVRNGIIVVAAGDSTGLTISDGTISGMGGYGVTNPTAGATVAMSDVTVSGSTGESGFHTSGASTLTLTDCTAYNNVKDGFFAGTDSTVTCTRCIAYGNGSAAAGFGDGFTAHGGSTMTLNQCLGYGNADTGAAFTDATTAVTINNCTFYGNGESKDERNSQIWINSTSGVFTIKNTVTSSLSADRYNVMITAVAVAGTATYIFDYNGYDDGQKFSYDGGDVSFADWKTATSGDANSINSDPLFVSATDFNLKPGSPCLNAGVDVDCASCTDLNGNVVTAADGSALPRFGASPDIGAYEHKQMGNLLW